ncbi:hypothetical protein P886_0266 [Alteromonadaceae bacterium 2753L.S.0a.02]|nr:hypothetical protein P886_0266 [Alteromonadaceae bacterium 2753L.S.0a.02]
MIKPVKWAASNEKWRFFAINPSGQSHFIALYVAARSFKITKLHSRRLDGNKMASGRRE